MKILRNTVVALGNKLRRERFVYFSETAPTTPEKDPLVSKVETAMKTKEVRSGTKSEAAFVMLSVLDKKYPGNGILTQTEKDNEMATVGKNGTKYLKQFQEENVPYFKNNNLSGDGIASPNKSTWRAILLEAECLSERGDVLQQITKNEDRLRTEVIEKSKSDLSKKTEAKSENYEITLPDWFVNTKNDEVRIATINDLAKGFAQFARRSEGGGNEATIVKALKAIHSDAFSNVIFNGHKKGEKLTVSTDQLKKVLPGLAPEDYERILVLLEQISEGIDPEQGKDLVEKFNQTGETHGELLEDASLKSKKLLVTTTWGDKPLEVEVLDNGFYGVRIMTHKGFKEYHLNRKNLDKLVKGETIPSPTKENEVLAQAQGHVFELKKEKDKKVVRFMSEKGRDINIDWKLIYGETTALNDGGIKFPDGMKKEDALKIISNSVHYLTNMLDTETLHDAMRVNGDGRIYLTGGAIGKILQNVLDNSVEGLTYRTKTTEAETSREYFISKDKINAFTHRAAETLFKDDSKKMMQWNVNRITNTDWDRLTEGATVEEKIRFFGIPLKTVEKELSRAGFVAGKAKGKDQFELFERKMHTDLQKLLNDEIINNLDKYEAFEKEVIRRGKVKWEVLQKDKSFLGKLFKKEPTGDQLKNILFRMGSFSLLEKSQTDGTFDLATEYRKIYEGTESEIKGLREAFSNQEQAKILNKIGLAEKDLTQTFAEGTNQKLFADLEGSSIKLGFGISGLKRHKSTPKTKREYMGTEVETFVDSVVSTETTTTTTYGEWKTSEVIKWQEKETLEDGSIKVTDYEKTVSVRENEDGTVTVVEVDTNTKTQKKENYKITKYKKNKPKQRFHCTIDATQNLARIEALPGLDLSLDGGIGTDLARFSDTAYGSLTFGAKGQLTQNTNLSAAVGQKWQNEGRINSSASLDLIQRIDDNLSIFAGISSNSLDAFSESMGLDLERLTASGGATYSIDKWNIDATLKVSKGKDFEKIALLLKKNKAYFTKGLNKAISSVSNEEADAYTKELENNQNLSVSFLEKNRTKAKEFLGSSKYANAVAGTLTKAGVSVAEIGMDRVLSLVLGFAIDAKVIKDIVPHENKGHEKMRSYLQKSGDYIKNLRHAKTVELKTLSLGNNSYRLLPKNYIRSYVPQNLANEGKYAEMNVYVDPQYKGKITVNDNGTFTPKDGININPFVLNKTLADGHTEINIYLGDYKAGAFDSATCMSSERLKNNEGFKLEEKLNTGTERVSVKERIKIKKLVFNSIETKIFEAIQKDRAVYERVCAIENRFKNMVKAKNVKNFKLRINALKEKNYDDPIVAQMVGTFDNLQPHEIVSSLVKARMKYDAEKLHGKDFKIEKDKGDYAKVLKKKKTYAEKYKAKWKSAMKVLGVDNLDKLGNFANPTTALKAVMESDKNDPPKLYSGGRAYIMAKNGIPVVLNQVNNTEIMHAQEKEVITQKGRFKIVTGYLRECRNPMFLIQELPTHESKTKSSTKMTLVSDQENTATRKGLSIRSLDLAFGLSFSPPSFSKTVSYEHNTTTEEQNTQETETTESFRKWQEEQSELIKETTIIPPEPPCDPGEITIIGNDGPGEAPIVSF